MVLLVRSSVLPAALLSSFKQFNEPPPAGHVRERVGTPRWWLVTQESPQRATNLRLRCTFTREAVRKRRVQRGRIAAVDGMKAPERENGPGGNQSGLLTCAAAPLSFSSFVHEDTKTVCSVMARAIGRVLI